MILPDKFASVYKATTEITIDQCAVNSKIQPTHLLNILQAVAGKHSALGGMSYFDMQKHHQAWVLSSMRIEMDNLPQWHEEIAVETWIETLTGIKSIRDFEVFLNNDKIIGVNSLWVVLNTLKRRPEAIVLPHDHLQKFPDRKPTTHSFGKIDLNQPTDLVGEHTVVYSDLDALNHVNNAKYVEWCLDCLPIDILLDGTITAIDLNFLKEVNLGEKVSIYSAFVEKEVYFYLKLNEIVCFVMKLTLNKNVS